ncbi:hypothetical protein ACO0LM_00585 [Undibacterium sp. Di26W]
MLAQTILSKNRIRVTTQVIKMIDAKFQKGDYANGSAIYCSIIVVMRKQSSGISSTRERGGNQAGVC